MKVLLIIFDVVLFVDVLYYIYIHIRTNRLEKELQNFIAQKKSENEFLDEKAKTGKLQQFLKENLKED